MSRSDLGHRRHALTDTYDDRRVPADTASRYLSYEVHSLDTSFDDLYMTSRHGLAGRHGGQWCLHTCVGEADD